MKRFLRPLAFWLGTILIWELALYTAAYSGFERFLPALGFSLAYAAVLAVLTGIPGWVGRVTDCILPPLLFLIYAVQLVYFEVFGSFLSLAFVSIGGEAIATFWSVILGAIWLQLPRLVMMLLPLAAFYVLRRIGRLQDLHWKSLAAMSAVAVAAAAGTVLALPLLGEGANSPAVLLRSPAAAVDRWVENFGILTSEVLDLSRQGETPVPELTFSTEPALDMAPEEEETPIPRNILELDFDKLAAGTQDAAIESLNTYISSLTATPQNEYTGLFHDYNLIVVCAEAFSNYLIDPELTPTLYRMSSEGIVFRNFYNSFPNLTTNGEYSLCTGLMPDLTRMSFATSVNNFMPFCLGSICTEAGMDSFAYHNNVGTFYNRVNTHTNMGYTFKALDHGLELTPGTPTSDLEMLEKTVDDYLSTEPFHAYYMTYSGHADYQFSSNSMSAKNQALVAELDCSETIKAYLACQLELEFAMEYLLQRLEEAGIAERTVVVLTGDHMPYGLPEKEYAALAGDAVSEPFWQYRNSFICWTAGLEEPVVVEDYCCTQDILPTLLNLFGLPYDSRLLTGRDVLADCTHLAILKNGSFLSKELIYDADTEQITWLTEEDLQLAERMIQTVNDRFAVSAAILATDYYGYVFRTLDLSTGETERESYASYADIEGVWYEEAVELLTSYGALSGGGDGDFVGSNSASRADFVAMMVRGMGLSGGSEALPFTDVAPERWYYEPISAAWDAGFLAKAQRFRPVANIKRAEAELLLSRAAAAAGMLETDAGAWAAQLMADTLALQTQHDPETPANVVTRGAAAYTVAALLRQLEELPDEPLHQKADEAAVGS